VGARRADSGTTANPQEIEEVVPLSKLKKRRAKFYAEESLRQPVVDHLRSRGLVIETAAEAGLRRRTDEDHSAHAWRTGRVLLAEDKDFLNPRRFPLVKAPGTVVFDFGDGTSREIIRALTPLAHVWHYPDFYDRWVKILAHADHWTEDTLFLDGTSARTRMRFRRGRVEWWVDSVPQAPPRGKR
jgi:predicted nuclease of predicted toxin-antitoxin system